MLSRSRSYSAPTARDHGIVTACARVEAWCSSCPDTAMFSAFYEPNRSATPLTSFISAHQNMRHGGIPSAFSVVPNDERCIRSRQFERPPTSIEDGQLAHEEPPVVNGDGEADETPSGARPGVVTAYADGALAPRCRYCSGAVHRRHHRRRSTVRLRTRMRRSTF